MTTAKIGDLRLEIAKKLVALIVEHKGMCPYVRVQVRCSNEYKEIFCDAEDTTYCHGLNYDMLDSEVVCVWSGRGRPCDIVGCPLLRQLENS